MNGIDRLSPTADVPADAAHGGSGNACSRAQTYRATVDGVGRDATATDLRHLAEMMADIADDQRAKALGRNGLVCALIDALEHTYKIAITARNDGSHGMDITAHMRRLLSIEKAGQ